MMIFYKSSSAKDEKIVSDNNELQINYVNYAKFSLSSYYEDVYNLIETLSSHPFFARLVTNYFKKVIYFFIAIFT